MNQRSKVIELYKKLLHLGKEWPQGQKIFNERLHRAFLKNKDVNDPEKVELLLKHGTFVSKEIEALYALKKYRTLKNRYYTSRIEDLTKYDF